MSPTRATALSVLLLIGIGAASCGGAPPPPNPATSDASGDAGEQDKIEKSKRKIADANRAFNVKSYDKARKLLAEASQLAVESQKYEIDELLEKIDKKEARLHANEAEEKLKQKDCAGAFKDLAAAIDQKKSEAFSRELRRLVQTQSIQCVQASVDESTLAGNYAAARTLVNAKETKTVLGPAWKKTAAELDGTIAEALKAQVADDLKAKKWSDAIAKLDASVKKGDADESQASIILKSIREAVAPEVAAVCTKAIGQRDAAASLRAVDATIKLVRWEALPPDAAALAKDKALPEDLARKREALATWVEGQHLGLKPLKKPEKRWTYGKLPVVPGSKADGESKRDLPSGTEVWLIGQTKDKALVAETRPEGTSTAAVFEKAAAWVPLDRLAKESTADWVPPDDQLKGARVWAPLRPPDTLLELGTVSDVSGKEISVKRLADDAVVKVQRSSLRNGRLAPGTKVTAVCRTKDETAKIEELLTAGRAVPAVKIKCDGGEEKEEFLPALRAKPEFLPASK